jgi:hypothetical protein
MSLFCTFQHVWFLYRQTHRSGPPRGCAIWAKSFPRHKKTISILRFRPISLETTLPLHKSRLRSAVQAPTVFKGCYYSDRVSTQFIHHSLPRWIHCSPSRVVSSQFQFDDTRTSTYLHVHSGHFHFGSLVQCAYVEDDYSIQNTHSVKTIPGFTVRNLSIPYTVDACGYRSSNTGGSTWAVP